MIGDSIASFSLSGMCEVDKDKCMTLVMTGYSGPMHSFSSHVCIGSNEHVSEADSWINFLNFAQSYLHNNPVWWKLVPRYVKHSVR